jgi:hypothetical protein
MFFTSFAIISRQALAKPCHVKIIRLFFISLTLITVIA